MRKCDVNEVFGELVGSTRDLIIRSAILSHYVIKVLEEIDKLFDVTLASLWQNVSSSRFD